jgi:hypothetical protein
MKPPSGQATGWSFSIPAITAGMATLSSFAPYNVAQAMATTPPSLQAAGQSTHGGPVLDERLLNAKLEAVEARTETKFAQLLGELKVISANVMGLTNQVADVKGDLSTVKTEIAGVRAATAGVKWNIMAMGLALGGLIVAIVAFGTQVLDLAASLVGVNG